LTTAVRQSRFGRGAALARLLLRIGGRYAARSPRLLFASVQQREELRYDLAFRSADDVAEELGSMKGVLMKVGQMASYIYEDLPDYFRAAMGRLQQNAPPMSPELSSSVIEEELGDVPERVFAVAVKVQYPGIAASITSDMRNAALVRKIIGAAFRGLDVESLVNELGERLKEEVDYRREAENQELFATYYEGHPFIHVPHVIKEFSTGRVLTTELVVGSSFEELLTWSQREKDLAAETIYRFVFRSLYRLHAFNGDPHPGNYLFHGGGRVTFLDFGLTKRFTGDDLAPLEDAVRFIVFEKDYEAFRHALERAGFLKAGAPVSTQLVVDRFGQFYSTVMEDAPMTMTPEFSSAIVRRFFDARSPLAPYSDVPRVYVVMQRINLGLYAVLGSLHAHANWRRIAEEIWPFKNGPPATPIGEAEARWEQDRAKVPA
jgi:predicted unusual protein kinase regulating ubiquinone biosynthesis (AarF/ABC1/UbiB family)